MLANRVQITLVFVNLLRDATEALRKCPPAGRRIKIWTEALADDMGEASVADTGTGFDPSMLDMPFVSAKRNKRMGVGLSICRRIIEQYGGTFSVANDHSGGVVFCFTLRNSRLTLEPDE